MRRSEEEGLSEEVRQRWIESQRSEELRRRLQEEHIRALLYGGGVLTPPREEDDEEEEEEVHSEEEPDAQWNLPEEEVEGHEKEPELYFYDDEACNYWRQDDEDHVEDCEWYIQVRYTGQEEEEPEEEPECVVGILLLSVE